MKLVLHVGPAKTGSSYIQTNLEDHRDALGSLGVLYRISGGARSFKHLDLTNALINEQFNEAETLIKELLETGAHTLVLSDEAMAVSLKPEAIKWLSGFFTETVVVYYFRAWPKRVPSNYQQRVKAGMTLIFPEYLMPALLKPRNSHFTNPGLILDKFQKAVGSQSILALDFDRAVREDLFRHFLRKVLGLTIDLPPVDRGLNQSISLIDQEIIRFWNMAGREPHAHWAPFLESAKKRGIDDLSEMLRPYVESIVLRDHGPPFRDLHNELSRFGLSVGTTEVTAQYVSSSYLVKPKVVAEMRRVAGVPE